MTHLRKETLTLLYERTDPRFRLPPSFAWMVQRPLKTKQLPTAVNAHPSTSLAAPTTSASTAASTALGQITFTQSLSVVRTMMAVSFGCIAYLRFVRLSLPPS